MATARRVVRNLPPGARTTGVNQKLVQDAATKVLIGRVLMRLRNRPEIAATVRNGLKANNWFLQTTLRQKRMEGNEPATHTEQAWSFVRLVFGQFRPDGSRSVLRCKKESPLT